MKPEGIDRFEIVNGPEDGTSFPIARSPFYVGTDGDCAIPVQLDPAVPGHAAQLTAVSDGYRVRWVDGPGVYVNERRAGLVRSRVVRDGGILQVGNTLLALQCAPGGLASRSWGLPVTSDLGWAVRVGSGALLGGLGRLRRFLFGRRLRLIKLALTFAVLYILMSAFAPMTLDRIEYRVQSFGYQTQQALLGAIRRLAN